MKRRTENSESVSRKRKSPGTNPFLQLQRAAFPADKSVNQQHELVLSHSLRFSEATRKSKKAQEESNELVETVEFLLEYLESHEELDTSTTVQSLLTPVDIATMLLQWAVKNLVHASTNSTISPESISRYWKTLRGCLDVLLQSRSGLHTDVSSYLSQSTLNKLVPFAVRTALEVDQDTDSASCYIMLVDRLHRPTMDAVCHTLLPLVDKNLTKPATLGADGRLILATASHLRILESTVQLLKRLQRTSNPKKVFQLLAEPAVLSVLARWRLTAMDNDASGDIKVDQAVQELLMEGLFSPLHHVDGFRSLNLVVPVMKDHASGKDDKDRKAFHCYQEALLQTLSQLIVTGRSSAEENVSSNDDNTTIAMALVLPDLVKGLMEMFANWERDSTAKLKRKGSRDLAPVQFRLWSNMVYPLVSKLQSFVSDRVEMDRRSDVTFALLQSLRKALSLVLEHNLYLPSHKDDNNASFSFLEALATLFLDILGTKMESPDGASCIESECLQGLETLLRLNHLVVHERLPKVVAACGRTSSSSYQNEYQKSLLLGIIKTYHRLRQLNHLFESLLKAADTMGDSSGTDSGLVTLKALLLESNVRHGLGEAVTKCPSNQTRDLFEILNCWIQERCNESSDGTCDVSLAVSLYIALVQSIRVDQHTSSDITLLCEDAIKKAVYPLIQASKEDGSSHKERKREGILLTGWLVDLKNRCAFWIDRIDDDGERKGPNVVPTILRESGLGEILSNEDVTMDSLPVSMSKEILFLLLHRIRELHADIYEEQCTELTNGEKVHFGSTSIDEARRLVGVVFGIAKSRNKSRSSTSASTSWKLLSETVSFWAPYSKTEHVEMFLSWMFSALSSTEQSGAGEPESIYSQEESSVPVAKALLRDASFFEIPEIANQFHRIAVRYVIDCMKLAVASDSKKLNDPASSIVIKGLDLTNVRGEYSVKELGDAMGTLTPSKLKRVLKGGVVAPDPLMQATHILRILNGVPLAATSESLGQSMKLDILVCSLLLMSESSSSVETAALSMLCALRAYMAALVSNRIDIVSDEGFALFARGFIQSTSQVFEHLSTPDVKVSLLTASGVVMEGFTTSCLSLYRAGRSEPLICLSECIRALLDDERANDNDNENAHVLVAMCRPLLKRMSLHYQSHLVPDAKSGADIVSPLVKSARRLLGAMSSHDELFRAQCLLLNGDTTRLASLVEPVDSNDDIDLSIVETSLKADNESLKRAARYNLACAVASGHHGAVTTQLVLGECLAGPLQLMAATFCRLVRTMEAHEVSELLGRIRQESCHTSDNKLQALRLFQLMLRHVQDEAARTELSKVSRTFFSLSCQLVRPIDKAHLISWVESCRLGVSLLVTLTENKDVISIRERDLSFMLVQVASVLGGRVTFRNTNVDSVGSRVYSSCCKLVSSLLQRFPKQLYACAPTVILTMHVLFNHTLYGSLSDQEVATRAQMVTRLCELLVPHRDVYKKHVLVLVLEYVRALRSGVHPSRSKVLVPAVYCLLDMITQFETDQLNTMMDTTSKALFRSVYQSHQKTHMYKGQY